MKQHILRLVGWGALISCCMTAPEGKFDIAQAQDAELKVTACHPQPWAIYLSPGFEPHTPYGGYHITIAGFSNYHACKFGPNGMEDQLQQAWKKFHDMKPFTFRNVGAAGADVQGFLPMTHKMVNFKSALLNNFANDLLKNRDFYKLHGPNDGKGGKAEPWHVSLYSNNLQAEWDRIVQKPWRLYLVRGNLPPECESSGTNCPEGNWIEINCQRGTANR